MNAPTAIRYPVETARGQDELLIAPSLERRRLQCYLAMMVADMVAILIGFGGFGYLYVGKAGFIEATASGQILLPFFLTIGLYNAAYSIEALHRPVDGIFRALTALAMSAAAVVFIAFLAKTSTDFSRVSFLFGSVCAAALLVWARLQMRSFVRWRCGQSVLNELVIDDGGPEIGRSDALRVSARRMDLRPDLNNPAALHRIGLVLRNIDRVTVSCPPERRAAWAMMLKGANVEGEILDDEVVRLGAQGARVQGGHGLLLVSAGPLGLRARAFKRAFDVAFALVALVALAPFMAIIALAIRLEDGGPVLFVQRRMGRGNCFFDMLKFRSMSVAQADRDGAVSASRQDQRVTRIGRFIRRTSIDELPQLINVLLGDMSIVGPRPHAIGSQAGNKKFWEVDSRYWQRHCLKPGLSGLAQVRGYRGATDHESDLVNRLQSDLEYLEGWTLMRDIKIIVRTLGVMVHDRAY